MERGKSTRPRSRKDHRLTIRPRVLDRAQGGPHSLAVQTAAGQRGDLQNEPISNERAQPTSQSASIDVAGRVPKDLDLRQSRKRNLFTRSCVCSSSTAEWSIP